MSDAIAEQVRVPDDKPPAWANSIMRWTLTTPGLQRTVGKGVALLTFTGRRSGREYVVPVSYHRDGDTVTVITKRIRKWWHNFEGPVDVVLRLAGVDHTGTARIEHDDAEALEFMTAYLAKRPIDAKAYGLAKDRITRSEIARILPQVVVLRIELTRS